VNNSLVYRQVDKVVTWERKAEDRTRDFSVISFKVITSGILSGLCDPDHMSLEDLVTDADDKLFTLNLYSKPNIMFYTVYFLIVQILIIILGQGVIILC